MHIFSLFRKRNNCAVILVIDELFDLIGLKYIDQSLDLCGVLISVLDSNHIHICHCGLRIALLIGEGIFLRS